MDFARIALSQAWQVTALIVFILIVTRFVARDRPHLAYLLWLVVLVKCVTPPLWSSPSGAFSWAQAMLAFQAPRSPDGRAAATPEAIETDFDFDAQPQADAAEVTVQFQSYDFPVEAADVPLSLPQEAEGAFDLQVAFLLIWGLGLVVALLVTGYRWLHCLWVLWRAPEVEAPGLEAVLLKLARQLKVRRQVRLLITSSRIGPAVIGLLRPLIVLPEVVVRGKQPEELEAILAHELIHVRRGDLWLGLLQVGAKAVWWFYPLVWWVNRLATREAERCCDEEVLGELGCDPRCYARSLLEVLELRRTLQPVPASPGMKPVEVTSQRLERIMKLGQGCHKRTPPWCWAITLLLAMTALPGAAFIVADEQTETKDAFQEPAAAKQDDAGKSPYAVSGGNRFGFKGVGTTVTCPDGGTILIGGVKRLQDESSKTPLVVRSYSAKNSLPEIRQEFGGDDSEALQTFGNLLIAAASKHAHPDSFKDRVQVGDGTVVVAATAEEHRQMAAAVERIEKYGLARMSVEIRFVSASERVVQQKIKDWELTPVDLGSEDAGIAPPHGLEPIGRPWPTDTTRPIAKAQATTMTNLPALYKIVDERETQRLLEQLAKDKRTNVLSAPKVTLFNGQSATIADSTKRPFVVAVTAVGEEVKAAQPQIRVVECGSILRLRPLLRDAERLWLDYDIKVSHLEDVRETTVHAAGFAEPVKLQVPKVHTARIESAVEFALGKTVVIGGLTTVSDRGKEDQLLVFMTAKRRHDGPRNAINIEKQRPSKLAAGPSNGGVAAALAEFDAPKLKDEWRHHVPIWGPVTAGGKVGPVPPPTDNEVLQALEKTRGKDSTRPSEKGRFKVRIVKEKIADYVDPPRFVPTIGPAQLHHAHYKCTVYCSLWVDVDEPKPHKIEKQLTEVVYVDHTHFHSVGNVDTRSQDLTSIHEKLEQRGDIHVRNGTLSTWLDEIQKVWDVYIVSEVADSETTLSGEFVDTPLKDVLAQVLPAERCSFRCVEQSLLITRTKADLGAHAERRHAIESAGDTVTRQLSRQVSADYSRRPLAAVLEDISSQTGVSIFIDKADIALDGATPETLVTFQSRQNKIKAESALTAILGSLNLRYEVSGEKLVVRGNSSELVYANVYGVADLLTENLEFITPKNFQSEHAQVARRNLDLLRTVIPQRVAPDRWRSTGGPGAIESFPTNLSLVVSQTGRVQREVADFLSDVRKRLGLVTASPPRQQHRAPSRRSETLYHKVYAVADLVVPVPRFNAGEQPRTDAAAADFETLIDLVTSTVAPGTWEGQGGAGAITDYPQNLSLVVSQTSDVHHQLAELLQQLRRLQDLQVTVEARFIQIPADFFQRLGIDFDTADDDKPSLGLADLQDSGFALLSRQEAFFLLKLVEASKHATTIAIPKVTTFNGQVAKLSLANQGAVQGGSFQFQAVCSDDRRSVRLGFAVGADADLKDRAIRTIASGQALLANVSNDITSEMLGVAPPIAGVPMLGDIPYVSRVFKSTKLPTERLLLITPTIIVQEEERLMLGGVTPHIIVEEEEEELGIEITP